jgi:hypothetical protein
MASVRMGRKRIIGRGEIIRTGRDCQAQDYLISVLKEGKSVLE